MTCLDTIRTTATKMVMALLDLSNSHDSDVTENR